jgi:hypothetical protein
LKFLRSMDLLDGVNLLTDMDASSGKWSVVVSVSTFTEATRSLDTQMWLMMDSCSLALPSYLTCRPWDLYMMPISNHLMLGSATALSWASIKHLCLYLTSYLLAVLRLPLPARTTLTTSADAACNYSLTLDRAVVSRARSDHSL